MKKQFLMVLLAGLAVVQFGNAQEKKEEKKFGVKWSGYVNADYILDTRRSTTAREGQLMVLPMPKVDGVDYKGNKVEDVNAESSFNGFAIESRLMATITGPDAFGMKTKGVIEAHFFGGPVNTLGLRHAFLTLSNDKVEILFGQYWHPNFVTNVSPGTIDFNAGLPYQSFNRSPQIRFTTKGNVRFIGALLTELDFKTKGGSARYSTLPTANLQLQFGDDSKFVGGVGVNVKTVDTNPREARIDPTTKTKLPIIGEDRNKTSVSFLGYAKANLGGSAAWKLWGQYGGNTSELLNIGAYALNKSGNEVVDAQVLSAWTELSGNFGGNTGWGIFFGYAMNNGFGEETSSIIAADNVTGGGLIKDSYRVSPRITWSSGKVGFGIELGYTAATYANGVATNGEILAKDIESVGNFRSALSATYSF